MKLKLNKVVPPRVKAELDPLIKALTLIKKKVDGIIKNAYNNKCSDFRNYIEVDADGTVQIQVNGTERKGSGVFHFKYPNS